MILVWIYKNRFSLELGLLTQLEHDVEWCQMTLYVHWYGVLGNKLICELGFGFIVNQTQ